MGIDFGKAKPDTLRRILRVALAAVLCFAFLPTGSLVYASSAFGASKIAAPAKIKLTASSASKVKVTWGKVSKATAYQVRWSTSTSMKNAKTKVTGSRSITASGLKAGTRYYFQIRSGKKPSSAKQGYGWGKWSNKRSVKTQYSITYKTNGGSIETGAITSFGATTKTFSLPQASKLGYSFKGWYKDKSLTGKPVKTVKKGSTGSKTFYAKWSKQSYEITYDLAGGTLESAPSGYDIDTPTFELPTPQRPGYSFGGWYLDEGHAKYTDAVIEGSVGDKTLHAVWLDPATTLKPTSVVYQDYCEPKEGVIVIDSTDVLISEDKSVVIVGSDVAKKIGIKSEIVVMDDSYRGTAIKVSQIKQRNDGRVELKGKCLKPTEVFSVMQFSGTSTVVSTLKSQTMSLRALNGGQLFGATVSWEEWESFNYGERSVEISTSGSCSMTIDYRIETEFLKIKTLRIANHVSSSDSTTLTGTIDCDIPLPEVAVSAGPLEVGLFLHAEANASFVHEGEDTYTVSLDTSRRNGWIALDHEKSKPSSAFETTARVGLLAKIGIQVLEHNIINTGVNAGGYVSKKLYLDHGDLDCVQDSSGAYAEAYLEVGEMELEGGLSYGGDLSIELELYAAHFEKGERVPECTYDSTESGAVGSGTNTGPTVDRISGNDSFDNAQIIPYNAVVSGVFEQSWFEVRHYFAYEAPRDGVLAITLKADSGGAMDFSTIGLGTYDCNHDSYRSALASVNKYYSISASPNPSYHTFRQFEPTLRTIAVKKGLNYIVLSCSTLFEQPSYSFSMRYVEGDVSLLPTKTKVGATEYSAAWKPIEDVPVYQYRYATSAEDLEKARVQFTLKRSLKITGLKKATKYYLQIRPGYRTDEDTVSEAGKPPLYHVSFSGWPGIKEFTTKG